MLKLIKKGNSLLVQGENNSFYPNDGDNSYPLNSITLVIDESDMVTFRSVATNDVLFSGLIKDITINGSAVTKDNIIQKFDEISNASTVNSVNGMTGDVVIDIPDTSTLATKEEVNTLSTTVEELSGEVAVNKTDIQTIKTKQTEDGAKIASLVNDVTDVQNDISTLEVDVADINRNMDRELGKKQDKLVSGTNIKTINNESILGSGNIEITGGSGGGSSAKEWTFPNTYFDYNTSGKTGDYMFNDFDITISFDEVKLGDILIDSNNNKVVVTTISANYKYGIFSPSESTINSRAQRLVGIYRKSDKTTLRLRTTLPQKDESSSMHYGVDSNTLFNLGQITESYKKITLTPEENPNFNGVSINTKTNATVVEPVSSGNNNGLLIGFYVYNTEHPNNECIATKITESHANLYNYIVLDGHTIVNTDASGNWKVEPSDTMSFMGYDSLIVLCVTDNYQEIKSEYSTEYFTLEVGKEYIFKSSNIFGENLFGMCQCDYADVSFIETKSCVDSDASNQLYNNHNNKQYMIRNEANEWVGTQAQYDALTSKKDYIIYYITE